MHTLFAWLQATNTSVVAMVLQAAAGIAIPMAATWLAMQVTKLSAKVNAMADWEKRIIVVCYAVVLSGISHALGLKLPEAWGALGSTDIQAVLSAGVAFLVHRLLNPKGAP